MNETYGTATVAKNFDTGELTVMHADDVILVSQELLKSESLAYLEGVLTLDTAGKYRYQRLRAHDSYSDVFERITDG